MISLNTLTMEYQIPVDQTGLESLLLDLAAGDQEALAQLYHRARTAVFGLALSYLKCRADAEDVTQDTFVRAWENAPGYRPQGKPLAWLLAIARLNLVLRRRDEAAGAEPDHRASGGGLGASGHRRHPDGGGPGGSHSRPAPSGRRGAEDRSAPCRHRPEAS